MPTNVYFTNGSNAAVLMELDNMGPDNSFWDSYHTVATNIPAGASNLQVFTVDRGPGNGDHTTMAELRFVVDGDYVASLQIMLTVQALLKGAELIWNIRTPDSRVYPCVTDYLSQSAVIVNKGWQFRLTVTATQTVGFEDLYLEISRNVVRARWMESFASSIGNKSLNSVAIPGSHDSGTSSITDVREWSPDSKWYMTFQKTLVSKWGRTQSRDVATQLSEGIRYLDLRIAPAKGNLTSNYVCVHSLEGDNLQLILQTISTFLASSPREIVIIDFQKFFGMESGHHAVVVTMIRNALGKYLASPQTFRPTSKVSEFWNADKRAIVAYACDDAVTANSDILWRREKAESGSTISSPHDPDINTVTELHTNLTAVLARRSQNQFVVLQGILTGGLKEIKVPGFSWDSLHEWAKTSTNPALADWITKEWSGKNPNIIISDFYEESDILTKVLQLNS